MAEKEHPRQQQEQTAGGAGSCPSTARFQLYGTRETRIGYVARPMARFCDGHTLHAQISLQQPLANTWNLKSSFFCLITPVGPPLRAPRALAEEAAKLFPQGALALATGHRQAWPGSPQRLGNQKMIPRALPCNRAALPFPQALARSK